MALTFTGKLGKGIVEVSRPNPIFEEPPRYQLSLKQYLNHSGGASVVAETEPSLEELEDLISGLAQIHGNIDIRIWKEQKEQTTDGTTNLR